MLFNSGQFIYFFVVVVGIYFLLPQKWRTIFLLLASCYFYIVFVPKYILVLGTVIVIDYFAGIYIEKSQGLKRKLLLGASLFANIGILVFFKYFNFFDANIHALAEFLHWNYSLKLLNVILPIGLSFHTFQALSYTIEVYKGRQKSEHHFFTYALYVMFFPQLVAGPIERPYNLLHQFYEEHKFEYQRITDGLKLMAWGFVKKAVIADRLAVLVNMVYGDLNNFHGAEFMIAAVFFSFQLYCDFSGYTDIARGAAKVLGFKLMENFERPFFSKSIAEFWRRWHISLSSWFRDYVYYPIAFSGRRSETRLFLAILVTFFLSGFWHGAGWTYIIWGVLYGVYIIVSILTKNLREKIWQLLGLASAVKFRNVAAVFITFSLVTLTTVFFRASSVSEAIYIFRHLFSGLNKDQLKNFLPNLQMTPQTFILSVLLILALVCVELLQRKGDLIPRLNKQPVWLRWLVYYFVFFVILFLSVGSGKQFIYFQF